MSQRMYKVGSVARIAKVTVRTLHHYDEIALLTPSGRSRTRYRLYTDADIERLQQIRFHRELGMGLEQIRGIIDAPDFEARTALLGHRRQLMLRLADTEALIATIDRMLGTTDGDATMSNEELFEGFRPEQYEAEVQERWGNTVAWEQSRRRTNAYAPEDWQKIQAEGTAILEAMAGRMAAGDAPDSPNAMAIAEQHRQHIDRWFYACSPQTHAGLAEMYTADERFTDYYNRHADGLAEFVAAAIRANSDRIETISEG